MHKLPDTPLAHADLYRTSAEQRVGFLSRLFPSLMAYARVTQVVFWSANMSKRGLYDNDAWCTGSWAVMRALEKVGFQIECEGMRNIHSFDGPAVFIGNHMSTLETFVLPVIIQPMKDVTFVVKQSLIDYPVFGHVMRSRNPIVVSRDNPRQDLVTVLEGGRERLAAGRSVILFPQTTRSSSFDPSQFNSLGVKLAKSAGVPIVPIALRTDGWGNGRMLKDFGPMNPKIPVHFAFGRPMRVEGTGRAEHDAVAAFIEERLRTWGAHVQSPAPGDAQSS